MTEQEYLIYVEGYKKSVDWFANGFLAPSDVSGAQGKSEYSRDPVFINAFVTQLKKINQALLSDMNLFLKYRNKISQAHDKLISDLSYNAGDTPENQELINTIKQQNEAFRKIYHGKDYKP